MQASEQSYVHTTRILDFLRQQPGSTAPEVREATKLAPMGNRLSDMHRRGQVRREGTPRHYRYFPLGESA